MHLPRYFADRAAGEVAFSPTLGCKVAVAARDKMAEPAFPGAHSRGWADPGSDFFDNCHPVGEYIGYTWNHLPVKKDRPALPRAAEATPAIFAARMAFSNF